MENLSQKEKVCRSNSAFTSKDKYRRLLIYSFTSISRSEMENLSQKEKVCRSNSASFHLH